MKHIELFASIVLITIASTHPAVAQTMCQGDSEEIGDSQPPYKVVDGAFVQHNGRRYHNRPLYCNHMPGFVLAGDRPHLRFARDPYVYGCMMIAIGREGQAKWLHELSDIVSIYRPGRMQWKLSDASMPGVSIVLEAVTMADRCGMSVQMSVAGSRNGDSVIWAYGGAGKRTNKTLPNIAWELDPRGTVALLSRGFVAEDCTNNRIEITDGRFVLHPPAYDSSEKITMHTVAGRCSAGEMIVADATLWKDPRKLVKADNPTQPLLCGTVPLKQGENTLYWAVEAYADDKPGDTVRLQDPAGTFRKGIERVDAVVRQVVVDTPEPSLNAGVAAACHAINGVYYPPVYVHGGMLWNVPFPGWRTIYGPTAFGWHENVKTQGAYYIAAQEKDNSRKSAKSEPSVGLSQESSGSRFYGRGRIQQDNHFYNFQTQFFDQMIHAWRWTGDREFETKLRPAVEMQLEWARECFDPDDDGLYESYINTWPTDSVWYAGGAGAEETAYAYRGHVAAAEMARRAGDANAETAHRERAEKIRKAFRERLWIPSRGYVGSYIEQTGPRRLHEDAWLYSELCPIDAGMLTAEEAVQALRYTEWGLERVRPVCGGERCWTSNWVPAVWSTRVLYGGDNYHLALAYFKAGLAEQGWDLLKGNYLTSMLYSPVPGDCGSPIGGTDFTDVTSMFNRAVVEGLFGYQPDYPNATVVCVPRFPNSWNHASITTPDFSLSFQRKDGEDTYTLKLARSAKVRFGIPISSRQLDSVMLNGQKTKADVEPGYGTSIVNVDLPETSQVTIVIKSQQTISPAVLVSVETESGQSITLESKSGPIVRCQDPQSVLADIKVTDGKVTAKVTNNAGHHLVSALVDLGGLQRWELFDVHVKDAQADRVRAAEIVREVPKDAKWQCVDIRGAINGDIRAIYKQEYLSPRPNTCSIRIGSDGYSPWTFYYWNIKPPAIDLSGVSKLLAPDGKLVTPQSVPFSWNGEDRNIAFTSTWENWPRSIRVPVGGKGNAIWFLLCGTTNPMQTRIANGVVRIRYADGVTESIDLVPPENFWMLCPLGNADYDYKKNAFCLPKDPPLTVQLGANCRAILLGHRLRSNHAVESVQLETLSPEVVIGLMGVSVMK